MDIPLLIISITIFSLTLLIILSNYKKWHLGLLDEGFCLAYPARLVIKGKLPYRDFYYNYPPGKILFLGLLFRLFGVNLKTARIMYSFVPPIIAAAIYNLGVMITNGGYIISLLAPILYIIHLFPRKDMYYVIPLENGLFSDRMIFALFSLITIFYYTQDNNYIYLLTSGILTGLTILWGQEVGIYLLITNIYLLFVNTSLPETYIIYLGGFLFPVILIISFFLISRISLKKVLKEVFLDIFVLATKKDIKDKLPSLLENVPSKMTKLEMAEFFKNKIHLVIFNLRFYLPFAIYIILAIAFLLLYKAGQLRLYYNSLALFLFSILHIPMYLSHPDYSYIVRISESLYPLKAFLICHAISVMNMDTVSLFWRIPIFYLSILFLFWILYDFCNAFLTCKLEIGEFKDKVYLPHKNGDIFLERAPGTDLINLISYLKDELKENEKILVIPADPIVYFLSDRENITYSNAFLSLYSEEVFKTAIADIKRSVPEIVINNTAQYNNFFPANADFRVFGRLLYESIMKNYAVDRNIGRYEILKRI